MSEYHKIETLYERDEKTHKLKRPLTLKNRVYGCVNPWVWTEKIDGTNIRCIWHEGVLTFAGRTDNAQTHPDLLKWLATNITAEKMQNTFPTSSVVLYGEGYGAGIQKGGGNYSVEKKFILFDVSVHDDTGHDWWLADDNMRGVGEKLNIDVVPLFGEMTLEQAATLVEMGIKSKVGSQLAEGLVGRPIEALFDKKGHRLIVKLKTKDF